jgi:hypothetical protein
MAHLVVRGGTRLAGRVTVGGNKNAALPLLAACLLTSETCELRNVPQIRDVAVMIQLLRSLGATVEGEGTSTLRVTCARIDSGSPDSALVGRLRGSVLLMGALLARVGWAALAAPGGDFPARRSITTHLCALEALGARGIDHRLEAPAGLRASCVKVRSAAPVRRPGRSERLGRADGVTADTSAPGCELPPFLARAMKPTASLGPRRRRETQTEHSRDTRSATSDCARVFVT